MKSEVAVQRRELTAKPDAPDAGYNLLYKRNGTWYEQGSDGVEIALFGGAGVRVLNFAAAGRINLVLNTWRSFSSPWGHHYFNMTQGMGNGANPAVATAYTKGMMVAEDCTLKKIEGVLSRNSVEATDLDISFDVARSGTALHIDTYNSTLIQANINEPFSLVENFPLQKGDMLFVSGRKVNGTTASVFCSFGVSMVAEA